MFEDLNCFLLSPPSPHSDKTLPQRKGGSFKATGCIYLFDYAVGWG